MVLRSPESLSVRTRLCQLGIDPRDDSPDHQGTHEAATEPRHITAKATAQFYELTGGVQFRRQWDSDAYIAGLADRYPETMQRFTHGEGVLEQFINQKAMLAASPVERGEALTMLDAIEVRQDALDAVRDTVSDHYRIEHGTRTVANIDELPLPPDGDQAVYHRMTYLGDSRWKYESVVPRSVDAAELDPISVEMEFLADPGTAEHDAVREWCEWGVPLKDARVRTMMTGGPFADHEAVEATASFVESGGEAPSLYLRCVKSDGESRFRLPLTVTARSKGPHTGWLRMVASTPEQGIDVELRFKQGGDADWKIQAGDVDGRNPEAVRDELRVLLGIGVDDVISVENAAGQSLIQTSDVAMPTALEAIYQPVARHLTHLQSYTVSALVMPSVREITDSQFNYLSLLASIYDGTAHQWSWRWVTFQMPEDADEAERIREGVTDLLAGGALVKVEEPAFQLGNRTYTIDHPLASTTHSVQLESGADAATLRPGDTFRVVPGTDDGVTTAKIVDWAPGSIELN